MFYENNGYKIKRTYGFDIKENSDSYYTTIKVKFHGINGFDRKKMFIFSENPKLKKFNKDYNYFKNYATTFEALSFYIEILLKFSGRIHIKSGFFNKNFILISKYIKNTDEVFITMAIIGGFFKKNPIKFKKDITVEEILEEIKKFKKYQ